MKNVALLALFTVAPLLFCAGQETWQNYNTGNSPLLTNSVSSILVDHDDNLWGAYAGAGGNGSGVVKFNGTTWTHYNTSNSGLPNNDVRAIAVDPQGNLWFACYNAGIVKFNGTTWTRYHAGNSGIAGNDAVTIKFDYSNRLWVGCYFSGVSSFDGSSWTTYNKSNAPFPDNNCINAITIGKDNSVWIGMDCQGGLAKFAPLYNTWTSYKTTNSQIADHTVTSIFEDVDGKIWLGHLNNYVSSFDGTTWKNYTPQKRIYGFASDENGELWGCGNGLFKLEGSDWNETTVDGMPDNYSYVSQSLTVASDGRIWWSVQGRGIWTNPDPEVSTFERTPDGFIPVYSGKIKWVDLDNDLDLDILYCGFDEGDPLTMVYENVSGVYTAKVTSLPDIRNGSFATGDYDNDGDLDILIGGLSDVAIARLYRNNGNFSFSLVNTLPGLMNATFSWVDLDNDNDLDFLLSGDHEAISVETYVYENKGGGLFSILSGTNLPNCGQCSMDWADSDGDGKLDLLISGFGNSSTPVTSVYLNNGNMTFTKDTDSVLKSLFNGDVQWGNFDNDNDMDALISGFAADGLAYSIVYENKNGVLEERTDIQIMTAAENWWNGTAWADFNGDGNLDILVTGRGISQIVVSLGFKIFLNDGQGQFAEAIDADFAGISDSSVDCADYDADGDPDIAFLGTTGIKPVTGIYENKINDPKRNYPPAFEISKLITVEEDFESFSIQPKAIPVAPWEQDQIVTYSLEALDEEKLTAAIDAATGKITFSSIPNAFGTTSYRMTANDGQTEYNTYSTTIVVDVTPVEENVTGIEQSLSETMKVYPNPVSTNLTVAAGKQINQPFTIIISDIRGSEVRRLVTSDENSVIDMEALNTGVYILRIINDHENSKPQKVIKR